MNKPRKESSDKTPQQLITARLYEYFKTLGIPLPMFGAIKRRVKFLIDETKDPDMVELVVMSVAREELDNFSILLSLGAMGFDYSRRLLDVPEGAWEYALWEDKLIENEGSSTSDDKVALRRSIGYWLGKWRDAEASYDDSGMKTAEKWLIKLKD